MMNAIKYVDKLIESGFTPQQAKGCVNETVEIMNENLASKEDLKEVCHQMDKEFLKVRSEMIEGFADIKLEMKDMENHIVYKLGGIIVLVTSILGYVLKKTG
jgi:hypothetical protein